MSRSELDVTIIAQVNVVKTHVNYLPSNTVEKGFKGFNEKGLQFHVCSHTCYKLYSGKRCILGEGKRLDGETVDLQYPVWLLHNNDSNVMKRTLSQ